MMSETLNAKARAFRTLHRRGEPLVLVNAWDAGSASAIARAGAFAIATGSWAVAAAHGFEDGEHLPVDLAIDNLARIVATVDLPVSIDIEEGYGEGPSDAAETVARTARAGAVGCNVEDRIAATGRLRETDDQTKRLRAMRDAADQARPGYFINARTDVFFQGPASYRPDLVDLALERAHAYADAGADGIFMPGLLDLTLIRRIVDKSPLPLNIMIAEGAPSLKELAAAGVARISHGPAPYLSAMRTVEDAARTAFDKITSRRAA
jgi:2-methylisocitrate lyase-like PEP mutase family enzyme